MVAFDAAQGLVAHRHISPFWRTQEVLRAIFTPWNTLATHVKVVDAFAEDLIRQRRESAEAMNSSDLLARFMAIQDENGDNLNDKQLRDIILNFIIAGRDTTAQALSWSFYLLTQNPETEARLLEEINTYIDPDMGPSQLYEAIKNMKYAHAYFYEVLRLYPSVPINQKCALSEYTLSPSHFSFSLYFTLLLILFLLSPSTSR